MPVDVRLWQGLLAGCASVLKLQLQLELELCLTSGYTVWPMWGEASCDSSSLDCLIDVLLKQDCSFLFFAQGRLVRTRTLHAHQQKAGVQECHIGSTGSISHVTHACKLADVGVGAECNVVLLSQFHKLHTPLTWSIGNSH